MGILAGFLVLLAFMGGQVTNSHAQMVSSTVTYWHQKLTTTPIPSALEELILPDGDNKAVSVGVGVGVGKGGVHVGVEGKPPAKPTPAPKPRPTPTPKPKPNPPGVGVAVKPPVKGKGGGVSVRTPGRGVGVHVGTKSPYDYSYAADAPMLADPSLSMFLLEKDLHPGTKMTLQLVKLSTAQRTNFLPRSVADKIPFSSDKLAAATEAVRVSEGSDVALAMKETLKECESPAVRGESKYCATSLESMVDYATGRLGTNSVKVMLTDVAKDSVKQNYTITAVTFQSKPGAKSVVCHSQAYAYAVYYCHEAKGTKTVQVSLKGEDGTSAEGVAVCHADTSGWNPDHVAFKVLNVKPGGAAVCHFIPEDHVVWLPAN